MSSETARHPSALPADTTSFVGRDAELDGVLKLLETARTVTITGAAGIGKTRLALHAAARAAPGYADGVCLADLSTLSDPRLLPHTVADALGLPRPSAMEAIAGYLRDRKMLLVLDTCEHLTGACRDFTTTLTAYAPGVTVLATSRQQLGTPAEAVFPLSPLPVPESAADRTPGDAIDLFAQRAASAVPGFAVTDENHPIVQRLCVRLAGIPLAIELAAVRLRALSVQQLADGLDSHVLPLTGGRRTAVPRHRGLRTAIAWSYDLCAPAEQELWARLSVFAGSFDLDAALAVCAGAEVPDEEAACAFEGLAAKSVLDPDPAAAGGRPRFRMLGSIREFGAEKLAASGAETTMRSRHIARYLEMARRLDADPLRDQAGQYRALQREHADIRAAIEYALVIPGNDSAAVGIVTSLFLYWVMAGLLREGEYWLDRVLEHCPRGTPSRARVLVVRALMLIQLGDVTAARPDTESAIAIAESLGDTAIAARGKVVMHQLLTWEDDLAQADTVADEALPMLEAAGDTLCLALLHTQVALSRMQAKDLPACVRACEEALSRLPDGELWARSYLFGLAGTAQVMLGQGELGTAKQRAALAMKHELGDIIGIAYGIGLNGMTAAAQGRYERAAWLLGAYGPTWEHSGIRYAGHPFLEEAHRMATAITAAGLGESRYRQLSARAAAADVAEIVRLAVNDDDALTS
jgi:predicted ATPase